MLKEELVWFECREGLKALFCEDDLRKGSLWWKGLLDRN